MCSQCSTAPPSGRRDSSGIRLHLTRSLRRYDAGIMELGLVYTPVMAVPPQQRSFYLSGYCTSKCTRTVRSSALTQQHTSNRLRLASGFAQRFDPLRPCPASLPGSATRGHLDLCVAAAHAPGGPRREDRAGAGRQGAGGGAGGQALQRALPGPSCRGRWNSFFFSFCPLVINVQASCGSFLHTQTIRVLRKMVNVLPVSSNPQSLQRPLPADAKASDYPAAAAKAE